jgi:hypothetical protein
MRVPPPSRRVALQQIGLSALAALLTGAMPFGAALAEEEASWRFYRNAVPPFQILYPAKLTTRHVGKRIAPDATLVQEWQLPGGAGDIRLTTVDGSAGGNVLDWIQKHVGGNAVQADIAGLRGASIESLADGVYATAIYLDEPKSDKVIGFTLSIRNQPPGTTLNQAQLANRATVTEFWRMVESIDLGGDRG